MPFKKLSRRTFLTASSALAFLPYNCFDLFSSNDSSTFKEIKQDNKL
ncbi:colanic acid biosynthesis protein [Escherichia coli]|nr:colanic acid biosynthesis protein [Escherichia coli]